MEKTIQNLAKAFAGESMARNRYTYYASVAKKEGYEQISEIFKITAENEKQHAKWFLRMLNSLKQKKGEECITKIECDVETPLGTTKENLKSAINGENHEHSDLYPEFARIAKEEGLDEIAERIKAIAIAEKHHEERYKQLLKQIQENTTFKKSQKVWWVCRECGYVEYLETAPESCPSCSHPQAFFEVKTEEY
jgi:rubrerythrin